APTWVVWNAVMLGLAISLFALLWVAMGSTSFVLLTHVVLLIGLAGTLFALLSWFVAETGFVSVDQQMKELNLGENGDENSKIRGTNVTSGYKLCPFSFGRQIF
ncbi:hypothetical protein GOP47_0012756, partial [Adiantum capillus-veneris]